MPDGIRILAIDDAVANLAVIKGCLRGENFELTTQTNALEALQIFKEKFFDVVLLDVLMPGISGFELRKLIREIDKERPIIFFTSMIDDGSMTMLNQIAWDPHTFYLNKLTDKKILIQKINEVSGAHRARQLDKLRSRKLEEELQIAGKLQKLLLPPWCIADGTIAAGAVYAPSLLTSGDVFEVVHLADGKYLIFVGDIAGHGISAALYMTTIQTYLKMLSLLSDPQPHEMLAKLNEFVCTKIGNNAYLTALIAIVDFKTNTLTMHNAGHPPLLCCSPSKRTATELECPSDSPPLGWFSDANYKAEETLEYHFEDDDIFVALTDGVFDIEDDKGDTFPPEEFHALLADLVSESDSIVLPNRLLSVLNQIGYDRQLDDVTIVSFQKRQPGHCLIEIVLPPQLPVVDKVAVQFSTLVPDLSMQSKIELCIHEYLNNVIIHGGKFTRIDTPIYLAMHQVDDSYEIRGIDCSHPWNFAGQSDKDRESAEPEYELATSGRGIQILQSITHSISYNSYAGINEAIFLLEPNHESAKE